MRIDKKFRKSFDETPIADEYLEIVYCYVVLGLYPGGMFSAIFANDVQRAVLNSHPHNDWNQLKELMVWISRYAPPGCYGSFDVVGEWCQKDSKTRTEILNQHNLLDTIFDVIADT